MKSVSFAITSKGVFHVARYAIENIERAVAAAGLRGHVVPARHRFTQRVVKVADRLGMLRALYRGHRAIVVPMMGRLEWTLFPWTYTTEIIPIVFDCVPDEFSAWKQLFVRNRVTTAFFTAGRAADYFRREMPSGNWLWLPEAIEVAQYSALIPWAERTIDVLEFGRKYDHFHAQVESGIDKAGLHHLFERRKGELIFPSKSDFVLGLSNARISVCFPQSLTHPERFGSIETLTQRYLESMASGCILLGRAPLEMIDLFGYNPVVTADAADPVGQIRRIIERPEEHEELRRRNLAAVISDGSWNSRATQLVDLLASCGYRAESRDHNKSLSDAS